MAFLPLLLLPLLVHASAFSQTAKGVLKPRENGPSLWIVDGNNLQGQRAVKKTREELTEALLPIADQADRTVLLVFDGHFGQEGSFRELNPRFSVAVTERPQIADDYIVDALCSNQIEEDVLRIHVITADRELSERIMETPPWRKIAMVHPHKFWHSYLPSMTNGTISDKREKRRRQ